MRDLLPKTFSPKSEGHFYTHPLGYTILFPAPPHTSQQNPLTPGREEGKDYLMLRLSQDPAHLETAGIKCSPKLLLQVKPY